MPASRLSNDPRYALNVVCPYFTMFPLEYPLRLLRRWRQKQRILDPFCGRGTTLYAARVHGIEAWGIDSSPIAVAISRAKFASATTQQALALADELLESVQPTAIPEDCGATGDFWRWAYHGETLHQLCALREGLQGDDSDAAALLRGMVLGCLHGPRPRHEAPSYFSNQMPRTYAPKPRYAARFWQDRAMNPPLVDVRTPLAKKAHRLENDCVLCKQMHAAPIRRVLCGDSTEEASYAALPNGVDMVITSPPYFGMDTYVPDQWLRFWFLGGPTAPDFRHGTQVSHAGKHAFCASLTQVWNHMGNVAAKSLDLFVRFGSLPSQSVAADALLRQSLLDSGHCWRVVSMRRARTASSGYRQADQMGISSSAAVEYDMHAVFQNS